MNILLSCVGRRDPHNEQDMSEGAIVSLTRHLLAMGKKPERVSLFVTTGANSLETKAEETAFWLSDSVGIAAEAISICRLTECNPAIADEVFNAMRAAVTAETASFPPDADIHVGVSSGTPQMAQAWSVLAMLGLLGSATLWQVMSPNEPVADGIRVREISLHGFRRPTILDEVQRAVGVFQFSRAARSLRLFCNSVPQTQSVEAMRALARVLEGWDACDRWDFPGGEERLEGALKPLSKHPACEPVRKLVERELDPFPSNNPRNARVFTFFSAERRIARNDPIAALLLAVEALENALKDYLREDKLPLKDLLDKAHTKPDERWLAVEGAAGGWEGIDALRHARNDVAHDMKPPKGEMVAKARVVARVALIELCGHSEAEIDAHPFSPGLQKTAVLRTIDRLRREPA